jgi:hypothetical protein
VTSGDYDSGDSVSDFLFRIMGECSSVDPWLREQIGVVGERKT